MGKRGVPFQPSRLLLSVASAEPGAYQGRDMVMAARSAFVWTVALTAIYLRGPAQAASGYVQADDVQTAIGFASPEFALQALRGRAGIEFSELPAWTVATDRANQTVWLFAHRGDPAYPTVVKRAPAQTATGWHIKDWILCGGTQAACDKVAASFAK